MKTYKLDYSTFSAARVLVLFFLLWSSSTVFGLDDEKVKPLVDDKYRLSKDREELDKLRQQIPEEKRKENDEVAFTLSLMSELRLAPSEVREKFNTAIRKKRDLFNKDMKKYREDFTKNEKSDRDKFIKEIDADRKSRVGKKWSSDERKEFNEKIEARRKDFYMDQKEKREEFEATIRDQRKNFEDYAREKTNDFNQEHRAYVKRFEEFKKQKNEEKKQDQENRNHSVATNSSGSPQPTTKIVSPSAYGVTNEELEKAFQDAQSKPATNLEPGK
ncbi:MAG: hypothetical protein AABY64_13435 [Bdellovibrionota bacterium]